jgi:hypothetical protein
MYRKKFILLAEAVHEFILEPLKATAVCGHHATIPLIRGSVKFLEEKGLTYTEFKRADVKLWPPGRANVPGDHTTLWVQGSPHKMMRTRKRARDNEEVDDAVGRGVEDLSRLMNN